MEIAERAGGVIDIFTTTDRMASALLSWLLTARSANTRSGYATDVGYRYGDNGDGTYLLVRKPGAYALCDALERGGTDLLHADEAHILAWVDLLQRSGLAPVTVARKLAAASSLYRYLVRRRVVVEDPVRYVERPYVDPDESTTLGPDRDQARALLEWTRVHRSARDLAMVSVLLYAGLRVSEAVGADVEDLGEDRGHRTLKVTRKGGKVRRVPLAGPAWDPLAAYLAGRRSGPLFVTRDGRRVSRQVASQAVRTIAKRSGVSERFSAHSLRHGFATLALEAKVPLSDVQDAMGHSNARTTQRYNRARFRLDNHPGYALEKFLAG